MRGDRRRIVAGNWKMHLTVPAALALGRAIQEGLPPAPAAEVVLFPPATALWPLQQLLAGDPRMALGAQTAHWAEEGPHTGEIAVAMLAGCCTHVLVGHSERRREAGETDAVVRRKLEAVLAGGLRPMVAVGETLEEREGGRMAEVVSRQTQSAFTGLAPAEVERCTIAYEPVWAIGTGRVATVDDAAAAVGTIRGALAAAAGPGAAAVRILYGGSVTPENAGPLFAAPGVDGGLVGGASLEAAAFVAIVRAAEQGPA